MWAGSSALPGASRWAVRLSRAPPWVRGPKREHRRAGPGRLRPPWSPRQALRLQLLESQGPDIRDLEPPQATPLPPAPKGCRPHTPAATSSSPQTPSPSLSADHRSRSPPRIPAPTANPALHPESHPASQPVLLTSGPSPCLTCSHRHLSPFYSSAPPFFIPSNQTTQPTLHHPTPRPTPHSI